MGRYAAAVLFAVACHTALAGPPTPDAVRNHVAREMFRTATAEVDALLAAGEPTAETLSLLAELRLATGEPDAAEEAARKAVELEYESAARWDLWGRACLEVGLRLGARGKDADAVRPWFASAEKAFRRVRELDPSDPDACWRMGQAREWQGDHAVAEQFYGMQIDGFPAHPGGYRRLARLLANRANWCEGKDPAECRRLRDLAYATFEDGLAKAGEDAELLFLMGEVREEDGTEGLALARYIRSAKAGPAYKRAWDRIAERADPEMVIYPLAQEVLAKHPTAAVPAMWAGHFANRREARPGEKPWARNVEALGYLLPALAVHQEHEGLYKEAYAAAQVLFGKDPKQAPEPEKGLAAFKSIHESWPWSGDAANNIGFFYREAGDYDASLAWYLKSVARDPESQDILNDTGLIYLFHFPAEREKGLPYFLKTVALVEEGDQKPERGYWDALENLCKHYWEVERQPEKVVAYAKKRYETRKGVPPYNMSKVAEGYAKQARKALGR